MDSLRYLQKVGDRVRRSFADDRSLLSFQEWFEIFSERPRAQARGSARYLRDCLDFYGTEEVQRPGGPMRRFKLFDRPFDAVEGRAATSEGDSGTPVFGNEEVQNALYRILTTFVRRGRVDKLVLLHGPNGSAKSSLVAALLRGLEDYSHRDEGALYRFAWIFPSEKLVKGNIGFGEGATSTGQLATFAHLEFDQIDARIGCESKDHPLLLLPRAEREQLLNELVKPDGDFPIPLSLLEGELCHRCRQIQSALLQTYDGDLLQVLKHVQVERFFVARRYLQAAVTVEPQLSIDADYRQVTQDKSHGSLPAALQNLTLFEPFGPLVSANRGVIEFADLLKRPLEHYKYLLGTVETGVARLQHFLLHLDCVFIASSNEKHLSAFKEMPDFPSFKGRIELVRVPYLRLMSEETRVYEETLRGGIGKHVAPHAARVAAMWAVLTRLKKPLGDGYKGDQKKLIESLTPMEKLILYDHNEVPTRLDSQRAKELRRMLPELWAESDVFPNYEGRWGASAREIKTALANAVQNPHHKCLSVQGVLEELRALVKDKSTYEFLQQEVVDGFHDPEAFIGVVENRWLDAVDEEVREACGLASEKQYRELFDRYLQHAVAWVRGEKLLNKLTSDFERPDDEMMARVEGYLSAGGEDKKSFRGQLIAAIGAFRVDHPEEEI
ncbi:MAG: serine protein kinase PrkA, partial [Deltaproteobacteria bacterium]|nr:serine protein kinase PrkA [Deltaproteobacteria bacterium]